MTTNPNPNTKRTDVHRPSVLVTENYDYVGAYDSEAPCLNEHAIAYRRYLHELLADSHAAHAEDPEQCDHCGARLRYVAVLRHIPTGEHITVGETCLDNRFSLASADFHRMRRESALGREAARIREAAAAYRAEHTSTALAGETVWVDWAALDASANDFVRDVLAKLARYGSLSDRQLSAVCGAVRRDADRAAAPAAEVEVWLDVPTAKRARVTGDVLATKWQDSDYGGALKMLVRWETPAGNVKVWGTVPAAILSAVDGGTVKGSRVAFTADVAPSDRDPAFGLFRRPTSAELVASAEAVRGAEDGAV